MIKRMIMLIAASAMSHFALSQKITIMSIRMNNTDSICTTSPRYDINGTACAVIKFFTKDIIGTLDFKGNIIGPVLLEDSIYTVYVSNKTKRIKVYHPDYIPEVLDFTIFDNLRNGVESNKVYYAKICGKDKTKSNKYTNVLGARILSFSSEFTIRKLYVNGMEWPVINNSAKRMVPYGEYEYEALMDGNVSKKGKVDIVPSVGPMNIKIK